MTDAFNNVIQMFVLIWQVVTSHYILATGIAMLVLRIVLSGIEKLKKMLK